MPTQPLNELLHTEINATLLTTLTLVAASSTIEPSLIRKSLVTFVLSEVMCVLLTKQPLLHLTLATYPRHISDLTRRGSIHSGAPQPARPSWQASSTWRRISFSSSNWAWFSLWPCIYIFFSNSANSVARSTWRDYMEDPYQWWKYTQVWLFCPVRLSSLYPFHQSIITRN